MVYSMLIIKQPHPYALSQIALDQISADNLQYEQLGFRIEAMGLAQATVMRLLINPWVQIASWLLNIILLIQT